MATYETPGSGNIIFPAVISRIVFEYTGVIGGKPDISFTVFQYVENKDTIHFVDTGEIICFMVIEIESGCGTYVELTCRGAAHGVDVVVVQCIFGMSHQVVTGTAGLQIQ